MEIYQALYCYLTGFDAVVYADPFDDGRTGERPSYSVWMVPGTWTPEAKEPAQEAAY